MTRFEIIVNVNGEQKYVDTYDYEAISLNYNIADVQDISSRNSAYSKTIKVPDTRNNRIVFGDIGDLSIVDSTFNPNKKSRCWILVDTAVVFQGWIQVKGILDSLEIDFREYEVVVYAENDNFFSEMGDDFLTDLDFSELNHTWSEANIVKSWTQSWNWGYYYPLIDYGYNWDYEDIRGDYSPIAGSPWVKVEQMYPATNVKYIWDKIFREYGFSYNSDFLNSDVFEDLYIPFNRGGLVRDPNSIDGKFAVGLTDTYTFSFGATQVIAGGGQKLITQMKVPYNNENSPYGDPQNLYNTSTYVYTAPAQFIGGRFVADFDIQFLQGIPQWAEKTSPGSGYYATSICFKREFVPGTGQVPPPNPTIGAGTVIPIGNNFVPLPFLPTSIPTLQYWGTGTNINRVTGQIASDVLQDPSGSRRKLYPGEKVWVEVRYSIKLPVLVPIKIIAPGEPVMVYSTANKFYYIVSPNLVKGDIIPYNICIPNNFKQKDFIMSIVRMFNLYIEPSKQDEKVFFIEPRDQFYAKGRIKDWTYKLDISEVTGQVLGETQNRRTIFKYKEDSDYFNQDYQDIQAGITYGEYDYLLDNDFVKGEKKVEIAFSATPIVQVPESNLIAIPKIVKLNNNVFEPTTHNVRILTKARNKTTSAWPFNAYLVDSTSNNVILADLSFTPTAHTFQVGDIISVAISNVILNSIFTVVEIISPYRIRINLLGDVIGGGGLQNGIATPINGLVTTNSSQWSLEGKIYRAYPYLGHLNDPFEPSYDINFGQVTGYYYPESSTTNNNLFEIYYSNFIGEISDKDSRLIRANFYLTAEDIADFRYNDNIFINNQYYKVNKITDYDPGVEKTTGVELIKTKYITIPKVQSNKVLPDKNPNNVFVSITGPIKPTRSPGLITAGDNTTVRSTSLVNGKNNFVGGTRNFVSGSGNVVSSDGVSVLGSNNNVGIENANTLVVGSNNTISAGAGGSIVFGSYQQVFEANSLVFNGKFVVSADVVSASYNEVLNQYPDNKIINYVSASRNAVREPWSADVVNIISAGRIDETFL